MKIAILGASSQIAKDMISYFVKDTKSSLYLYSRKSANLEEELKSKNINFENINFLDYEFFSEKNYYDVILNFVGIGDPDKALKLGSSIFDITYEYDSLAMNNISKNPDTKYIFFSSGAVYGSNNFSSPPCDSSSSIISINNLESSDWYSISKIHSEARHRALLNSKIIDLRVFNYISSNIDIYGTFFISDAIRSIIKNETLHTTNSNFYRDYIGPDDLFSLINVIIYSNINNQPIDCYTKKHTSKFKILSMLEDCYGLNYQFSNKEYGLNYTGHKNYYYSENRNASSFGYKPAHTSLETIKIEVEKIINRY